jgi:uncharacterized protein with HEPN domain
VILAFTWRTLIADFRNRLAHGYFSVNTKIVWNLIQNRLPRLMGEIAPILASLEDFPPA